MAKELKHGIGKRGYLYALPAPSPTYEFDANWLEDVYSAAEAPFMVAFEAAAQESFNRHAPSAPYGEYCSSILANKALLWRSATRCVQTQGILSASLRRSEYGGISDRIGDYFRTTIDFFKNPLETKADKLSVSVADLGRSDCLFQSVCLDQSTLPAAQPLVVRVSFETPSKDRGRGAVGGYLIRPDGWLTEVPLPLIKLITCGHKSISRFGSETLEWLNSLDDALRNYWLQWLLSTITNGESSPFCGDDRNRIAVLEVLAAYGVKQYIEIAANLLQRRPLSDMHLFLLPLFRTPLACESASCVDELLNVYNDATAVDVQSDSLAYSIAVEVFRSLAETSPAALVQNLVADLPRLDGTQTTSLLDALINAVRGDSLADHDSISDTVAEMFHRYASEVSLSARDNLPGVVARLLELAALRSKSGRAILKMVNGHPFAMHFLYLLLQRPLDSLSAEDRIALYQEAIKLLNDAGQRLAIRKLLVDVISRDKQVHYDQLFHFGGKKECP